MKKMRDIPASVRRRRRRTTTTTLILTIAHASLSSVRARTVPRQQAANATNDGQVERMSFWVAQRALTAFHVGCVAHWQEQGTSGWGRTLLWYMPKQDIRD
jgi:hypothetical protein